MTTPRSIGQVAPAGNSGDREEFTKKDVIENVALVITAARTAKGPSGPFWILEAARQDTGERVVFTGATVVDQQIGQVRDQDAFPVLAMLSKIQPEGGGNPYWMLVDPPGTPDVAPTANGSPATSRIDEVGAFIERKVITVDDIPIFTKEIAGESKKVNDLDDDQYAALLERIREVESSVNAEPEF